MKAKPSRTITIMFIILLSLSSITIFNVEAQEDTITVSGNWTEVARFAGDRSGESIITDSFTCNHSEWRIRWEVDTTHMHFDISNYFLYITIFPEGTTLDYIDFINGSLSFLYDPANHRAGGTSYIHDNAGTFYLRIGTSPYVDKYRIYIEQNTDSPIASPSPTPSPNQSPTPAPTSSPNPNPSPSPGLEFPTIQVFVIIITILSGLGILAYSMRKK